LADVRRQLCLRRFVDFVGIGNQVPQAGIAHTVCATLNRVSPGYCAIPLNILLLPNQAVPAHD
jgi:hypothetical protein